MHIARQSHSAHLVDLELAPSHLLSTQVAAQQIAPLPEQAHRTQLAPQHLEPVLLEQLKLAIPTTPARPAHLLPSPLAGQPRAHLASLAQLRTTAPR